MSEFEPRPRNQETDPRYNAEPGIAVIPGSNLQKEYAKFEQNPWDKWAFGRPGNPYTYRPYPKMLYRAELVNGRAMCMMPQADPYNHPDPRAYERAEEHGRRFTERCQRVVKDDTEHSRAAEDGWRETPQEAVEYLEARETARANAAAERNYADRNMSDLAKREILAEQNATGGEHIPSMPEKRRGRPRKAVA